MSLLDKIFGTFSDKELKRIRPLSEKVLALEPQMQALSDAELRAKTDEFRQRLAGGATLDDLLPEAFAVCREADWRVLGLKPYPVQVIGGIVLHRACIAEMQTGEGKTLVATLPVYLNALAGEGVHVVTVNDYLARRDSEWMGKVYRFLGLTVGLVVHDVPAAQRHLAYQADVTYGTNNEFGFDYLRDNMAIYKKSMVQRGHAYAIVDEVDSILIDEARTPLIISGKGDDSSDDYVKADRFVSMLKKGVVVELDSKVEMEEQDTGDCDYLVDEKRKTCTLTERGVKKAEAHFNVSNLADAENMELRHYIDGALKAHGVMHRDTDYIVKDGEVIIVDEFTGRLMYGRRYNDGLHQAIEAKEGVKVAAESKTLATITFQNYFRMYKKLAGMTGTASTEADEFSEIYGLQIVSVPTNKPCVRKDLPDCVYKSTRGKYDAVVAQIRDCYQRGQPVLVGTVSVEKSEILHKMLRDIPHNVLNAKNHESEALIVAQAGKKGAVTIATNMAGRGTDIMLGGNVAFMAREALRRELTRTMQEELARRKDEYEHAKARAKASGQPLPVPPETDLAARLEMLLTECDGHADTLDPDVLAARARFEALCAEFAPAVAAEAEQVRAAGGLFIIGTERHESRRIDNQLRGRSGRQGDPGTSRFFLSLEDDLMRIFGGERVQNLMNTLGLEEDMPIEARMITSTIESAQKKLEASNFSIRKQVLQYDDVMNQQREIIYKQRRMVLDGEDISEQLHGMLRESVDESCATYLAGDDRALWDFDGLRRYYDPWLPAALDPGRIEGRRAAADTLYERGMAILADKEARYGAPMMRELERICLLRNVDSKWMDHIDNMDQLKQGMGLRGYGQHDPVVEYRIEGFAMFDEMVASIREDSVHMLLTIEVRRPEEPLQRVQVARATGEGAPPKPGAKGSAPIRVKKIGPNAPCPCGSGKKYKKCTCKEYHPDL